MIHSTSFVTILPYQYYFCNQSTRYNVYLYNLYNMMVKMWSSVYSSLHGINRAWCCICYASTHQIMLRLRKVSFGAAYRPACLAFTHVFTAVYYGSHVINLQPPRRDLRPPGFKICSPTQSVSTRLVL